MLGTIISHIMVARSTTLGGVARGRIIGGITGGMTPIAQAAVADVVRSTSIAMLGDCTRLNSTPGDRYPAPLQISKHMRTGRPAICIML